MVCKDRDAMWGFRDLVLDFINKIFKINNDFVPYMFDYSKDRKNVFCVRYYEYRYVNGEWFIEKRNTYLDLNETRVRILCDDIYSKISSYFGVDMHSFKIDVDMKTNPNDLVAEFSVKEDGDFKGMGVLSLVNPDKK